tara:strand:- start:4385 stop:6625 length:2241 start_codon:yes stop_codon:yes gene_type:complete
MAVTINNYTGDGSTNQYAITFQYLSQNDVVVTVNEVAAPFTFVNSSTVQITTTPSTGDRIVIKRNTSVAALVDFTDGSTLFEADLDLATQQARFLGEESRDRAESALETVNNNLTAILGVQAIAANVTKVANIDANVTTLAGISTDVSTLAAVSSDVDLLGGFTTEINTIGDDLNSGGFNAGTEYDLGSITAASSGQSGSPDGFIVSVYGKLNEISTVAGASSDITAVSNIASSVSAVAADATDIGNVSTNIANVNAVASNAANINAVNSNSANINSVAADATDIGAVATNIANVNAAASNATNINSVATNASNINAVAGDASNIGTVATAIANVNATAGIATEIAAVSGISSDVTAVAADATDIGNVATNIANVNAVASNVTNINAVNTNASNINAVAADITNIGNVATDIANVNAVATNIANVNAVNTNSANINTVAGADANITAVAGISTDVATVAGDATEIAALAAISSDVTSLANAIGSATTFTVTVAQSGGINVFYIDGSANPTLTLTRGSSYIFDLSDSSNSGHPLVFKDGSGNAYSTGVTSTGSAGSSGSQVQIDVASNAPSSLRYACSVHGNGMGNTITVVSSSLATVASNTTSMNTVSGSITNVNSVGGSIANVNTVASNLSSVNNFGEKYRTGATDPSSSLDTGDLFYNSTSNTLKVYNGSAWEAGVTAGSGFLALTGGTLTGTLGVTTVDWGDWTITETGGSLYFATGGTNKMKLDASGNLDVAGSVNANATIT